MSLLLLLIPRGGALHLLLVAPLLAGVIMAQEPDSITLPEIEIAAGNSLQHLLQQRRSIRSFAAAPLDLSAIGQLLWAAQGITHPKGLRTAPSAGALYPL